MQRKRVATIANVRGCSDSAVNLWESVVTNMCLCRECVVKVRGVVAAQVLSWWCRGGVVKNGEVYVK